MKPRVHQYVNMPLIATTQVKWALHLLVELALVAMIKAIALSAFANTAVLSARGNYISIDAWIEKN